MQVAQNVPTMVFRKLRFRTFFFQIRVIFLLDVIEGFDVKYKVGILESHSNIGKLDKIFAEN